MSPELILFVGLQGSGKSSFYRAGLTDRHVLFSKDRFPNNRHPARRQRQLIEEALGAGHSVVIDNTNPTPQDRDELIALAHLKKNVVTYQQRIRMQLDQALKSSLNLVWRTGIQHAYAHAEDVGRSLHHSRFGVGKNRVGRIA